MSDPEIDLPPHEWRSDREKPHEPFFGPGLKDALMYFGTWIATASVVYWFTH